MQRPVGGGVRRMLREFWAPVPTRSNAALFPFTVCAALVLMFFRRPHSVIHPEFWAEDGVIFFKQQLVHGFGTALTLPVAGYIYVAPRLVAAVAALFPMRAAPLVYSLCSLAVGSVACAWLSRAEFRRLVSDDRVRVGACLMFAFAAPAWELIGNATNLQWYLLWLGLMLLLSPLPETMSGRAMFVLAYAAIGLSGPVGIVLAPMWLVRLAVAPGLRERALCVAVVVPALIAAFAVDRHAGRPGGVLTVDGIVTLLAWRVVAAPFLGVAVREWVTSLGPIVPIVAATTELLVVGVILCYGTTAMRISVCLTLAIVGILLGATLAGRPLVMDIADASHIHLGGRYFWVPINVIVLLFAEALCVRPRYARAILVPPLVVMIGVAVMAKPLMDLPNQHWGRSVRRLKRAMEAGLSCTVRLPITPGGWIVHVRLRDGRPVPDARGESAEATPCWPAMARTSGT